MRYPPVGSWRVDVDDLEAYLARSTSAPDVADVRRVLTALRGRRPFVN